MTRKEKDHIPLKGRCEKCGTIYDLTWGKFKNRKRYNLPSRCPKCTREEANKKRAEYFNSLTPEQQKEFIEKRNWYARATPEQKAAHSQKTKDQLARRTEEEWKEVNKKNSEGLKKHWQTVSDEARTARTQPMLAAIAEKRSQMTDEEKSAIGRKWFDKLSPEEQERVRQEGREKMIAYNASLSDEEKKRRAEAMQEWHAKLTPMQKREFYRRTHAKFHNTSQDIVTTEDESDVVKPPREKNVLHHEFEMRWSQLNTDSSIIIKPEVITKFKCRHHWDYGVFDKDGKLIIVVDIDEPIGMGLITIMMGCMAMNAGMKRDI